MHQITLIYYRYTCIHTYSVFNVLEITGFRFHCLNQAWALLPWFKQNHSELDKQITKLLMTQRLVGNYVRPGKYSSPKKLPWLGSALFET